ncbi:polysaccharide biosynthesis C-terminal domain-containing protein [Hymenobacter sp. BT186]|uniref:Polysaccharide biosynthesis C-terminal domain-containing protein n=1 Tax=Hymenobacter telluris TaxID=2816474 RepID=A0A939ESS7_9BACT|nr:polysaccharide biosynthesis C-terminal domain-containing protein [Hymenobacter telluris]MBO0356612.1 polysaccharide biosynthesis C-terminal domain-containing protein [Hymenobacter telluris]MBW3372637.1 polysaccharide biosynthesis C-terminal domain-containing protein [Hymenobacter norwichensis]
MGIVQRQGLRNTIISYAGLGLGFVNTVLVLPKILEPQQIGLTGVLAAIATMLAQIAAFGFGNMGVRFFPYFRKPEAGHQGFLPFLLSVPLLGFALVAVLYLAGKPLVMSWYADEATDMVLLDQYYFWGLVLALFVLLINLWDAYLKGLYHTAFSSFTQEIVLRLLITGGALLFAAGYLDFHGYVLWYIGASSGVAVLLIAYTAFVGELHLRPASVASVRPLREMLSFGAFALLGNVSGVVISSIDSLMVSSKVDLDAAGIYGTAFFISTALVLPFRALYKIAFPLLADYWKSNDLPRMADFYQRTTRLNTMLGCYLALGIALNLDFIYAQMKPAYAAGSATVLILLAARLFDGITGVNGLIVVTSPRYRYDLIFNASLALATVLLNLLLIPHLGLTGAAVAAAIALVCINLARTWFVWYSFGLQPFDRRVPLILLLAAVAGGAAWLVPFVHSLLVTMLLRSTLLTVLYGGLLLATNAEPQVRETLQKLLRRSRSSR